MKNREHTKIMQKRLSSAVLGIVDQYAKDCHISKSQAECVVIKEVECGLLPEMKGMARKRRGFRIRRKKLN